MSALAASATVSRIIGCASRSSRSAADEAITGGREYIGATYGPDALPEKPNVYSSKEGAQDAHEAIRPTSFDLPPDAVRDFLKDEEFKLYKLVWDRFVASQMLPALFDVTQVDIENGRYVLRAAGKVLKRPGFLAVYRETPDEDAPATEESQEGMLPALREGEVLERVKVTADQKFTQPPAQFSEATLVKALEENGIGRPSTYATILSVLTDRDYVERLEGRFRPTQLGTLVNGMLQTGFHDILNEGYTAALEVQLDQIEDGTIPWKQAVADFDVKFSKDLETAGEQMPNVKKDGIPLDEKCPDCGSGLLMRFGRFGPFIACSNYPDCKYSRNVDETPAAAPADGQTVTLFTVEVSPTVSTGTVTFMSTAGTFPSTPVPIGIDHRATAGLTSPKTIGAASVTATVNTTGGSNGFSRQTPFRFDVALPNVITVMVDSLTVMPGGKVHVTAHFTRLVGQVSANTVAVFSATDANGASVGGFENVTVVQPAASGSDNTASADFLPGANAAPGPITISAGTDPPSVIGSTDITVINP